MQRSISAASYGKLRAAAGSYGQRTENIVRGGSSDRKKGAVERGGRVTENSQLADRTVLGGELGESIAQHVVARNVTRSATARHTLAVAVGDGVVQATRDVVLVAGGQEFGNL